ncbi:MAG: twin-arginine translocation signal domain-containing protein [Planctomycetes bacterium]|nr:twin-arginine translocation signal domain-containing protein [Planctomycetota bacterium]
MLNRRKFLKSAAAGSVLAAGASTNRWLQAAERSRKKLKITGIDRYEFYLPYHEFNATDLLRYHGYRIQANTVLLVRTNLGLVGAGQSWSVYDVTDEQRKRYIGTSPFDWLGSRKDLPFNMAMYDLMGKYLDIPAWKLIGEKVRDRIPVSAWTASVTPEHMAKEVKHAASLGYRWLKYHVDEVQNVVAQTRAMQAVAPRDFRVHYDFNMNSSRQAIEPVLDELKKFPIVGRIEDPITASDPEGWKHFRNRYEFPIVAHHAPVDFLVMGAADGYMAGHAPIGNAMRTAAVAEQTGSSLMLQQCGTYINQAFQAHEAAVFPAATMAQVNLAELWTEHFTQERMPIRDGSIAVPIGPGLGVTVNEEKLRDLAARPRPGYRPFLVRIVYGNGPTIVARHNPALGGHTDDMRFLSRLLGRKTELPGPKPGYMNDVRTDWWDDVDDPAWQRAWKATAQKKFVLL